MSNLNKIFKIAAKFERYDQSWHSEESKSIEYDNWTCPSFEEEEQEFYADWWGFSTEEIEKFKNQFKQANLIKLTDKIWKLLENTDSWSISNKEEAYELASKYEKNIDSVIQAIKTNHQLPAPILLHKDSSYYLIAGNTRLMACRILGIRPTVLMLKM